MSEQFDAIENAVRQVAAKATTDEQQVIIEAEARRWLSPVRARLAAAEARVAELEGQTARLVKASAELRDSFAEATSSVRAEWRANGDHLHSRFAKDYEWMKETLDEFDAAVAVALPVHHKETTDGAK